MGYLNWARTTNERKKQLISKAERDRGGGGGEEEREREGEETRERKREWRENTAKFPNKCQDPFPETHGALVRDTQNDIMLTAYCMKQIWKKKQMLNMVPKHLQKKLEHFD